MGRSRFALAVLGAAAMFWMTGCRESDVASDPGRGKSREPLVMTDNYPLAYCADYLAGNQMRIEFPAPADADPAYWIPSEDVIRRYQSADLILLNGAGYARWTETVSLPPSRVEDTSRYINDQLLRVSEVVVHKHGPEGEHAHEGIASHTWLDPNLLRRQSHVASEALKKLDVMGVPKAIDDGWESLDRDLAQLAWELESFAKQEGRPMLASHPVYDYLTAFCHWNTKSMHWEPGETPPAGEWEAFAKLHASHAATIMLWEGEPTPETRKRLADEFQVRCVVYSLCANRPESGDFMTVMRENVARLREAMTP